MLFKLALRNLLGGGIRSWLNIFIISVVLVAIIGFHGLYIGWQNDAERGMINWHLADGQFWHKNYDPYDVFSYEDSRGKRPENLVDERSVEFLVCQGVVYPDGRSRNVIIKGIEADQDILEFPSEYLTTKNEENKLVIGYRMAEKLGLSEGEQIVIRYRNKYGSFAAGEFEVAHIFKTSILSMDQGIVWVSLEKLQTMLETPDEITYLSYNGDKPQVNEEWVEKTLDQLLEEFRAVFATELAGGIFMYILLIFLAMIAVFDTQVLALFKRKKEVGMMMAMGMRRAQIIGLFTLEGLLSGLFAVILGFIWGTPLLIKFQETGMKLPEMMDSYGMNGLMEAMYPKYTVGLVLLTVSIIMIILLLVSYLPVRSISKMSPVEALK